MTTTALPKNSTIQIRLPRVIKEKIFQRANESGLSISEYARTLLLLASGALKEDTQRFWEETKNIEAECKTGNYKNTSAEDLIKIGKNARR